MPKWERLKFLMDKQGFDRKLEQAAVLYGQPTQEVMRIDHYYDDEALSLSRRGLFVRIRQDKTKPFFVCIRHDGVGETHLSIHEDGKPKDGFTVNEEAGYTDDGIPEEINLPEYGRLTRKGCLTSFRRSFFARLPVRLDMDVNTYLGLTDYVAELKYDYGYKYAMEVKRELGFRKKGIVQNKMVRFFAELERINVK